jgi:hypothetical protein
MAVSAYAIDNAEWTWCVDVQTVRSDQGGFIQQRTENPWAFVRFADPAEQRQYVVPFNGAAWIGANGLPAGRPGAAEIMPFLPFPLETARPARTSGGGSDNAGGAWAVHFFGWI